LILTIDVPLIWKVREIIFYQAKHIKGQFEGTGELGTRAVKQDRTGRTGQDSQRKQSR
jgi:hypothetical protein